MCVIKNCLSLCCLSVCFYFDSENFKEKGSRQEKKQMPRTLVLDPLIKFGRNMGAVHVAPYVREVTGELRGEWVDEHWVAAGIQILMIFFIGINEYNDPL
jgi:hypothetical protein